MERGVYYQTSSWRYCQKTKRHSPIGRKAQKKTKKKAGPPRRRQYYKDYHQFDGLKIIGRKDGRIIRNITSIIDILIFKIRVISVILVRTITDAFFFGRHQKTHGNPGYGIRA